MRYPAIIVERPTQKPAEAWVCDSPDAIISIASDQWSRSDCSEPEPVDVDSTLEYIGHDLHCITLLDSASDALKYITIREFGGDHNKGIDDVLRQAIAIGWADEEDEEDEALPWPDDVRAQFGRANNMPNANDEIACAGQQTGQTIPADVLDKIVAHRPRLATLAKTLQAHPKQAQQGEARR